MVTNFQLEESLDAKSGRYCFGSAGIRLLRSRGGRVWRFRVSSGPSDSNESRMERAQIMTRALHRWTGESHE